MRRLTIVVLVAGIAVTPALAATRDEHDFTMSFTKKARNASTGVAFKTDRTAYQPPAPGAEADRVTRTEFIMHPGTRTSLRAVAKRCTVEQLESIAGVGACPKGSKVGSGTAIAITPFADLNPLNAAVTVFAGRNGLVAHLDSLQDYVIELPMSKNRLTATVPRICLPPDEDPADGCSNGDVVLKTLEVTLQRRTRDGRALVRTPRRCPASGFWTNRAVYQYANGDTETQSFRTRCKR